MLSDSAVLLLRITAGVVVAGYGTQKLFGWFREGQAEESRESAARGTLRMVVGGAQGLAGIFLALGVDPIGPALLLGMAVLTLGSPDWRRALWGQVGAQFPLVLAVVAATVVVQGPGRYSVNEMVDSEIEIDRVGAEPTQRVIVRLEVPFRPEAKLSPLAREAQRGDIDEERAQVLSELAGTGSEQARSYETVPFVALEVSDEGLEELRRSPSVAGIEEDVPLEPFLAESVLLVEAAAAREAGLTGQGQTVAILDTGVDASHPFLAGKVVEEACYSAGQDCPNGSISQTGPGAGRPCTYAADCGHGTHVAGIVAGSGSSSSGVAPGATLMSVQVFSEFSGSSSCGVAGSCAKTYTSDLLKGLERVYGLRTKYRFAAVNMSLGGGGYQSYCDSSTLKPAIDNLRAAGVATIVASGNSGYIDAISSPACVSTAVSVGASTDVGVEMVAPFSNSAGFLSLLAPGADITSSGLGGGFDTYVGTSMAAPHVAGAWAVLRQKDPAASVTQVLNALEGSGLPVQDARNGVTTPRIRIYQAAFGVPPPAPGPSGLEVSLRLRGQVATGRLSGLGACSLPAKVGIQLGTGGWRTVRSVAVKADGSYVGRLPARPGRYRVVVTAQGEDSCVTTSPARRLRI